MRSLKIGDMVALKRDHQDMIVNRIDPKAGLHECIWFKGDGSIMASDFPLEALELSEARINRFLNRNPHLKRYNLLMGPFIPDAWDETDYEKGHNKPNEFSKSRNPYHDENADLDQQSQEFWDWF
ncbi:hypothetical protein [Pontiella sulfatireligans]|uniref:DUF2158 domain-containing protein n=1 Tax=Pontiella sulfatireligans TaxID=2750658 RepID=A0A6C2UQJ5_9BACT|nr:hypothetical protein [Pontiella sulfatireligans]VGO22560.1 hypothetical protein SCARR_04645 [Pontiella sulfatireligans]